MTTSHLPQVNRRRKTTIMLTPATVDALREHVLPLLPGVSLSDILDSFLKLFADAVVPMVLATKDVPEHMRAAVAEQAMYEALARVLVNAARPDPALFPPVEVDDG
jgi:hypothetical protein